MTTATRLRSANDILRAKGLTSMFLLGVSSFIGGADVIPEAVRASIDDMFPGEGIEFERVTMPNSGDLDNLDDGPFDIPDSTYYLGFSSEAQADRFFSAWNSEPLRHLCDPDDLLLITYFNAFSVEAADAQQIG